MIKFINRNKSKGAILILALWTMTLLAVFAAYVGLRVRQRASLISRIEDRSQLRFLAESGVKKAIAMIKLESDQSQGKLTAAGKQYLFNNLKEFSSIKVGIGEFSIYHDIKENLLTSKMYGVSDEESKINLNRADVKTIKRLINTVAHIREDDADSLAEAIINWREVHSTELTGFSSDNYYSSLKSPYEAKQAEFELFDELRLVKGMTRKVFDEVIPYVTIFGDGKININTASREVLLALGLDASIADKILIARRGNDHQEATEDDFIFQKTFDVVSEMKSFIDVQSFEADQIDRLNKEAKLKTASSFYRITCSALLRNEDRRFKTVAVYNQTDKWVEYWHEK